MVTGLVQDSRQQQLWKWACERPIHGGCSSPVFNPDPHQRGPKTLFQMSSDKELPGETEAQDTERKGTLSTFDIGIEFWTLAL